MGKISLESPHVNPETKLLRGESVSVSEDKTLAMPGGSSGAGASKVIPFRWKPPEDRPRWVEQSNLSPNANRVARSLSFMVLQGGPFDQMTRTATVEKIHGNINRHARKGERSLSLRSVERGFSELMRTGFVERSSDNNRPGRRRKAKGGRWIRLKCPEHDLGITAKKKRDRVAIGGNGPSVLKNGGNGPPIPHDLAETVPHTHRKLNTKKNTMGIQTVPSDVTSFPVERPAQVETPSPSQFSREVEAVTDSLELEVAREAGIFVEGRGRGGRLIEVQKALKRGYTVEELTEAVHGCLADRWALRHGVDIVAHAVRRAERYRRRHRPRPMMIPTADEMIDAAWRAEVRRYGA